MYAATKPQRDATFSPCARACSSTPCTSREAMPRPRSAAGVSVWTSVSTPPASRYSANAVPPNSLARRSDGM
jgi:hypothetical protein